ncbi:hypothetical protein [Methylosinus sp. PW1]|uniref:hypothetical protein n=1 Tax=Methylosinus sp. PW1 TaxID=107636 RepID=UPI0005604E59|nr:hypothetical protein [Methylosinus sp. PW1]
MSAACSAGSAADASFASDGAAVEATGAVWRRSSAAAGEVRELSASDGPSGSGEGRLDVTDHEGAAGSSKAAISACLAAMIPVSAAASEADDGGSTSPRGLRRSGLGADRTAGGRRYGGLSALGLQHLEGQGEYFALDGLRRLIRFGGDFRRLLAKARDEIRVVERLGFLKKTAHLLVLEPGARRGELRELIAQIPVDAERFDELFRILKRVGEIRLEVGITERSCGLSRNVSATRSIRPASCGSRASIWGRCSSSRASRSTVDR